MLGNGFRQNFLTPHDPINRYNNKDERTVMGKLP